MKYVDTNWLRQQMNRHRALRLPSGTYDAILVCLDELDEWRKAHESQPAEGEVSTVSEP
jgi:hypothetical protein